MHSVKINGKPYAVGLWWQVLKGSKKRDQLAHIRKQVAEFKDEDFNCYVIRKSQFGLGNLTGKIKSYPSLACALIDRTHGTWIGRFLLEDSDGKQLWWVCAIKDGKPLADGDAIFTSQHEADRHLEKIRAISKWEHEVLTETVAETEEHFKGLLKPAQRLHSLEEKSVPSSVRVIVVLLICAGFYMVYAKYEAHKLAEFNRKQQQIHAKDAQNRRKQLENSSELFFPKVWQKAPDVAHVAALCVPAMQDLPLYNRGWALLSSTCDTSTVPAQLKTEWKHTAGARFDALPVVFEEPAILDSITPTKAFSTHDLYVKRERPMSNLLTKEEAMGKIYQLTSAAQAHISLAWSPIKTHKESDVIGAPLVFTSPWRHSKWMLSSIPSAAITDRSLLTSLDKIPGIVIAQITYLHQGWTITGELYVQN